MSFTVLDAVSWLSHHLFVPIKNRVNIYIISVKKIVDEGRLDVEFHSQYSTPQRMTGTLVNEYIVTVQSPGKTKTQKEELFMSVPPCFFTFYLIYILFPVNVLTYYKRSCVFFKFVFGLVRVVFLKIYFSLRYASWESLTDSLSKWICGLFNNCNILHRNGGNVPVSK